MSVIYTAAGAKLSYDAEEIDALLAKINNRKVPNYNFLPNPHFLCNQRGKSSYSVGGTAEYTLDCCRMLRLDVTFDTDGKPIVETNGTSYGIISVRFANPERIHGKKVTISADMDIISETAGVGFVRNYDASSITTLATFTGTGRSIRKYTTGALGSNTTGFGIRFNVSGGSGAKVKLYGFKVEIGEESTLAEDEDDYTRELLECQRYLYCIRSNLNQSNPVAIGNAYSATQARFTIPLPVAMRADPTVNSTDLNTYQVSQGGTTHAITDSVAYIKNNMLYLHCTTTGLTAGDLCYLRALGSSSADKVLVFSAEI